MDSMIQLVDQHALSLYLSRAQHSITLRQQQMAAMTAMRGDDWWDKIKAYEEGNDFERCGSIAVIDIKGCLAYGYDFWMWLMDGCSYCGIINKVNCAADDSGVTKIVLNVNSPGGGVIGCPEAADAIFNARKKKEVVAVVNPEAASAGYWLASQAQRIVALSSGFVGSVGAEIDYQSFAGMLKELGIDVSIIRSAVSPDKNLGHAYEPISDKAKEYYQGLVDYSASKFIEQVARGRGMKESEVLANFGKGRMMFGAQALQAKMVDSLGDLASETQQVPSSGPTASQRRMRSENGSASSAVMNAREWQRAVRR